MEFVAAGVEGGSKRRIEADWDLHDVAALREHWSACGPPVHIATAVIAASLGNRLTREPPPTEQAQDEALAELFAMAPMVQRKGP